MNALRDFIDSSISTGVSVDEFLLRLLVAFIVGQFIAWCYVWTHHGVSYSRNLVQALILVCLIVCMVMSVIGTNIVAAFGLLGALSIIRFRTPVRDTRDTAFIFLELACGMTAGMGFLGVALVGAVVVCIVALYLDLSGFGSRRAMDASLQFQAAGGALRDDGIVSILRRFCSRFDLQSVNPSLSQRPGEPERFDCAYQVRLRDPEQSAGIIAELHQVQGVSLAQLHVHESHDEL